MPEKTPQDRKPKADEGHKFTVKGKSYKLPPISEAATLQIPGGVTMDAMLDPEDVQAQLTLALHMLRLTKPTDAAMKALRSLPTDEMLEVIGEWMGESSGSSAS